MSRQTTRATEVVPAHEVTVTSTTVTCDRCGIMSDPDDHMTNEILLGMDLDECVSYAWRRDYCAGCAEIVWDLLCAAIGVDPDAEGRHGFDDD